MERTVIKSQVFSTAQDLCDFINDNCIPVENIVDVIKTDDDFLVLYEVDIDG